MRRIGEQQKGDERILGNGAIVASMPSEADLLQRHRLANLDRKRMALAFLAKYGRNNGFSTEALGGGSRRHRVSRLSLELVYKCIEDLDLSSAESARRFEGLLMQWQRP